MVRTVFLTGIFFIFLCDLGLADAAKLAEKIQSQSYRTRVTALKVIERDSVASPEIYRALEEKLSQVKDSSDFSSSQADELAWACKAFAASGEASTEALLRSVADSGHPLLDRHCDKAADRLAFYRDRRQKLSSKASIPGLDPDLAKAVNLLQSGEATMQREAAKRIMRSGTSDARVYDLVRDALLEGAAKKNFGSNSLRNNSIDAYAWMCKALGASGLPQYVETLKKVRELSSEPKLDRYAGQAIDQLQN